MAEEELELDVNQAKKKSPILLIVIVILVLNVAGIGAWIFLGDSGDKSSSSAEKAKPDLGPLKYLTLVPEFIVNFGPGSKVRYLQVDLQVATRDKDALETIGTYRPVIRNDILTLLSSVSFDDLKDRSGKEVLQKKILNVINKVIASTGENANQKKKDSSDDKPSSEDEHLDGPIENVYFISFIMQ